MRNPGVSGRHLLWLLLASPAIPMTWPVLTGAEAWRYAIRPSGAFATQLLLVVLAITPLRQLLPGRRWIAWLVSRRRDLGIAAFGYATIHLAFFLASIGRLDHVVQGLAFASMWTGWLAWLLLVPMALTSSGRAARALGPAWKAVHLLIYPVAALVLAHWLLLTSGPLEAAAWFAPVLLLQSIRLGRHILAARKP